MIDFIKKLFGIAPAQPVAEPVPYKVETPQPAQCGCGRSQSGLCVGLHKLTPEEWATNDANPGKTVPAPKVEVTEKTAAKPAAMKATKKPAAKKPAAKKTAKPKKG